MPDAVGLGAAGEGEEGPEAEANAGASVAAAEAADGAASGVTLTGRDGAPDCDEAFSCSAPADAGGCQPQLHLEDKAEVVCRWQYLAWLDPFQPPRVHAAADAAPAASESTLECGGSVAVAGVGAGGGAARTPRLVLRKMWSYTGPGLLISVGYMDPGNWSTDITGGALFGYDLCFVVLVSSLAAMLLQALSLRLGAGSGRDLAQLCRERYPPWASRGLWLLAECAIAACDLAEVLGCAIALYILLGLPLAAGVLVTAGDVLLFLAISARSARVLEGVICVLIMVVAACFVFTLVRAAPPALPVLAGFLPRKRIFTNSLELYSAAGIIGATVMPHNLYLHSALVQSRAFPRTPAGRREAATYGTVDSCVALVFAGFVNAAILITAGAVWNGNADAVSALPQAARLLAPALGSQAATLLFGCGLLASGQQSTVTGTLAGQVVMEGLLGGSVRLKPWARRLVTRLVAMLPAVVVASGLGMGGVTTLLNLSQVVLSLQLPFAIYPLVRFAGDARLMGDLATPRHWQALAWLLFVTITVINAKLIVDFAKNPSGSRR